MDIEYFDYQIESQEEVDVMPVEYLKKVRTIKTMKQAKVDQFVINYYKTISSLDSKILQAEFAITKPNTQYKKQVCAKVFKPGDLLVQCYQCRIDGSCVICLDCFKSSNHDGHHYMIRKATGGCCDCGDKEAWRESGFCVNHTGKFLNIQIPEENLLKSRQKLHHLFYLYLYLNIKDHKRRQQFSSNFINFLIKQNKNSPYHNKITSQCLTSKLSMDLNPFLNNCTVLENILKFAISGQNISKWTELFMVMFGYYPFKYELLKVYIWRFGELVNGTEASFKCAGSISCQILTSHELIERYSMQFKYPLGYSQEYCPELSEKNMNQFIRYYRRLFYDLQRICKLSGNASLAYWRMHINNQGLPSLFRYYEEIVKYVETLHLKKYKQVNILVRIVEFSILEQDFIQCFLLILRVIRTEKDLMIGIIAYLFKACEFYHHHQHMEDALIFRPFQRCLGLALFSYFDLNLTNIRQNKSNIINQLFGTRQSYTQQINQILYKLVDTYLVYPKTIAEPGFGQSLQYFSYYYKSQYHLLFQVDVTCIKTFILMFSGDEDDRYSFLHIVQVYAKHKPKQLLLSSSVAFLRYLYTFNICQARISEEIYPKCSVYNAHTADLLIRYFNEHKGCVSMSRMAGFKAKLFSTQYEFISEWLMEHCVNDKQKRQFVLKKQHHKQGLDFNDLWDNSLYDSGFISDPWKTLGAITGENHEIFRMVWNDVTVDNLILLYESPKVGGCESIFANTLHVYLFLKYKNIQQYQPIQKWIIIPDRDKIPQELSARFNQQLKSLGNEIGVVSEPKEDEREKMKSKMEQLKMKKLQQMKEKQNKFLSNNMDQQPVANQQQPNAEEQKEQYICCICRTENKQNLAYLIRLQSRNSESILKLGKGIGCITYSSCFHTFCAGCFRNATEGKDKIRCPLCKVPAHFPLPFSPSIDTSMNQRIISQIAKFRLEYLKFQSTELTIISSFYHFILLCYADIQNTKSKRVNIYRLILNQLLSHIQRNKNELQIGLFSGFSEETNFNIAMEIFQIFLIAKLRIKQMSYSDVIEAMSRFKNIMFANLSLICFKILFEQNLTQEEQEFIKNYGNMQEFNPIKRLPLKYSEYSGRLHCTCCGKTTANLTECLLCDWVGCQYCLFGKTAKHNIEIHRGGIGVYMQTQTTMGFFQSTYGVCLMGPLYENYWGRGPERNNRLQEFELNAKKLKEMEDTLVYDKQINKYFTQNGRQFE